MEPNIYRLWTNFEIQGIYYLFGRPPARVASIPVIKIDFFISHRREALAFFYRKYSPIKI